jgi:hypothetical protein
MGRPAHPLSVEQIAEMSSLRLSGASLQEIADSNIFGCGRWTINSLMTRAGIQPESPKRQLRGAAHWAWRGGVLKRAPGYILQLVAPDDPMHVMAQRSGYVLQHRLVVARLIGRPLTSSESVHHINGNGRDNRPENLQLRQHKHGRGVRHQCADCGSYNVMPVKLDEQGIGSS